MIGCPICSCDKYTRLLDLDCGNFDNSKLYRYIRLNCCDSCGHVYNDLTSSEKNNLIKYYTEECAPMNLNPAVSNVGDRPGSINKFTKERHEKLFSLFSDLINKDSRILDIGCAMGGFLDFLSKKGFKNLYGIDVSQGYVDNSYDYDIKFGDAENIPFENNFFDVVVLDQVMEHIQEPIKAVIEIKRVLNNGGFVCIGVPDASEYNSSFFFDYYWLLLREHIQHFDLTHLKILMKGFKLVRSKKTESPMISDKMIFTNLNVLFQLEKNKATQLKDNMKKYLHNQVNSLIINQKIIDSLVKNQREIYLWGISREFMYLYENTNLRKCNIIGLIDDITLKQEKYTLEGRNILSNSILKEASEDSLLIITALAHKDIIRKKSLEIGFKGDIL